MSNRAARAFLGRTFGLNDVLTPAGARRAPATVGEKPERVRGRPFAFVFLVVVLVAALGMGVGIGGDPLGAASVFAALFHPHGGGTAAAIVWDLRLPRVLAGAVVGAELAASGFLLQGLLRNPLVDPFLTGTSAGAGAAIALALAFGLGAALAPVVGFAGGLAVGILVALLARRARGVDVERLILAGVSLSALCSALIVLALLRIGQASGDQILAWLAGSLATRTWSDLAAQAPYALVAALLAALAVPSLNALRLGDSVAHSVGVDVHRTQWLVLAAATLLAAGAVALAGIVGFVGLIVPHLARRLVGTDARPALLASALLGASLVPLADALGRTLAAPAEIPLGVVLAFVGVPSFLYLYLRPRGASRLWGT